MILVFPDLPSLWRNAAERFIGAAEVAIKNSGRFTVALSGGSTPRNLYSLLARAEFSSRVDWPKVHFFSGDERFVSTDSPDSNYRMIREALFDPLGIFPENVHWIRTNVEPPEAAAEYEERLRITFGSKTTFDLALLGMGEDAHTASIFPGLSAVTEESRWVSSEFVSQVSMSRVTLTPIAINSSALVIFIVTGARKASMLKRVLEGPRDPVTLPAQAIEPASGQILWLVDAAAANRLTRPQN